MGQNMVWIWVLPVTQTLISLKNMDLPCVSLPAFSLRHRRSSFSRVNVREQRLGRIFNERIHRFLMFKNQIIM